MDQLRNLPVPYRKIYKTHFKTIRTRIDKGTIKSVYHFLVTDNYTRQIIEKHLTEVLDDQASPFKLNIAYGCILKNIESDELRFFHPSHNTTIFDLPKIVKDLADITTFLDQLEQDDVFSHLYEQRPSTKWQVVKIVCVRVDVYRMSI